MTGRDAPHKNPARVPMVLQVMDKPTVHHEPAHVLTEVGLMPRTKIEKDGIYRDKAGNRFFMAAGDYTSREMEYDGPRGGKPEARRLDAAPENKARQAAPETKSKKAE